jgi:hypothetical protein
MNEPEFQLWVEHHTAAFLGFGAKVAALPDVPRDGTPSRRQVLQSWYRTLRDVSLTDAKAATDKMAAMPEADLPKGFDRHPAKILQIVRGAVKSSGWRPYKPRCVDGQETYRCLACRDTGIVSVWSERSLAAACDGTLGQHFTVSTIAVRCTCPPPSGHTWGYGWMPHVFDPKQMLPHAVPITTDADEQERMRLFVRSRRPANYHDEFANFA